ncbi:MAG: hypothetical protein U0Z53_26535 [Blastocatellia bacterium]
MSATSAPAPVALPIGEPELPRTFLETSYQPATGRTITVPAGGDLQSAIYNAQPGDVITLQAGATYTGNFTLPVKSGSNWIIIRTSTADSVLPAPGTRMTPDKSALLARVVSPNADAAMKTQSGAHHYRFIGLEFTIGTGVSPNYGVVQFGAGDGSQSTLDAVPHDLIIDRCWIHGNPTGDVSRGVALNSASSAVIDSYISDCHGVGFDTQAIAGWNGPGPFKIVNNYLEGAAENVLFGGSDPHIANLVPSDIEFRQNYCTKPLSWKTDDPTYAGRHWSVKNIFELKNAQRVLADGNIFEHNWVDAQNGYSILFTVRNQDGTAPWSVVQDVTFTNNTVRGVSSAINVLGRDYNYPSQQVARVKIKNNLFDQVTWDTWGGRGHFLLITDSADVRIENNTIMQTGNLCSAYGVVSTGFVFQNNIAPHNEYGLTGDGTSSGTATLNTYFPGSVFVGNVLAGGKSSLYPAGNYFPATLDDIGFVSRSTGNYRLSSASPYRNGGTDGKDPGVDFDALNNAQTGSASAGVVSPTPTPTPTPAPTPTPVPSGNSATVSFVSADSTTKGNWKTGYGSDGYNVIGDTSFIPAWASIKTSGNLSYTWAGSTTDARALKKVFSSDAVAACWYSGSSFTADVNLTDTASHRLALYFLDWDRNGRAQTVEVLDVLTGAVLDTRTISNFSEGQYLVWTVRGSVRFRFTRTAGSNAVLSGLFFGNGASPATATFVQADSRTRGNWKGAYGSQGYRVIGEATSDPSWATITASGNQNWVWNASTSDTRALQKALSNGRIAACWYAASSFTIDVMATDSATHRVSLYVLDWDNANRAQKIEVLDATSGAVLDSRTIQTFGNGLYLSWDLSGAVRFRITRTGGPNAVVSGLFFGAAGGTVSSYSTARDSSTVLASALPRVLGSFRIVR